MYSLRESPVLRALASIAANTSSGTSRIKMSAIVDLPLVDARRATISAPRLQRRPDEPDRDGEDRQVGQLVPCLELLVRAGAIEAESPTLYSTGPSIHPRPAS